MGCQLGAVCLFWVLGVGRGAGAVYASWWLASVVVGGVAVVVLAGRSCPVILVG